jgi:hypothetical protein
VFIKKKKNIEILHWLRNQLQNVGPAPVVRLVVSNAKFDVEKFDGKNNFGMW